MPRARLCHALILALSLAACAKDKDKTPVPAPDPAAQVNAARTENTETSAKVAPPAPEEPSAKVAPPASAEAKAEPAPVVKAAEGDTKKAPAPASGGSAEIALPKAKNGVLPKGAADKVLAVGGAPILKLLDAGGEPRADLSYGLTKGAAQKIQMAMDVTMAMQLGKKAMPASAVPQMTMLMDMATTDKNASGEWKIESRLTSVGVNSKGGPQDQIAAAMRPQLESMKGLGMKYWLSGKGHVRDFKVEVPATLPPGSEQMLQGMNQSFESMVAPLPIDPVGVGAKWQVVSRVASGGADLLQSATYTLKARTGAKATLDVTLVQLSASEALTPPGMPAGMSTRLTSFSSGGTGTSQIDMGTVAPEKGTLALKTGMVISVKGIGADGKETSVETTTKVTITRP